MKMLWAESADAANSKPCDPFDFVKQNSKLKRLNMICTHLSLAWLQCMLKGYIRDSKQTRIWYYAAKIHIIKLAAETLAQLLTSQTWPRDHLKRVVCT